MLCPVNVRAIVFEAESDYSGDWGLVPWRFNGGRLLAGYIFGYQVGVGGVEAIVLIWKPSGGVLAYVSNWRSLDGGLAWQPTYYCHT